MRHYRHYFEDTINTITELIPVLNKFDNVPTNDINFIITQQSFIDKNIQELIEQIITLLCTQREQINAKNAILSAEATMQANKNWEKQYEITAIKWMEVQMNPLSQARPDSSQIQKISPTEKTKTEGFIHSMISFLTKVFNKIGSRDKNSTDSNSIHKETSSSSDTIEMNSSKNEVISNEKLTKNYKAAITKVNLTLPNNNAISHHDSAQKQASDLGKEIENLNKKEEILHHELNSLFKQLIIHVEKMRTINKNIDLIQKHKDLLNKFSEKIKTMDNIFNTKIYFDKTIDILRHVSTTSDLSNSSQLAMIEAMETEN